MLRLKLSRAQVGSIPSIDMTPMIDMVFQLLIFFLLTSIMVSQPVLEMALPTAEHSEPNAEGKGIHLSIRRGGGIEIEQEEVLLEELEAVLTLKVERDQKKTLLISADQDVPFQRFVQVLDVASKLGLTDLAIVTQPPEGPP